MGLSIKDLEKLQKLGKIRSFTVQELKPATVNVGGRIVTKHWGTSDHRKDWISMNFLKWCNDRAITMQEEYKFHVERKWRFDWAAPAIKLAIEFEGGIFNPNGDHRSVKGIKRDVEKYNAAAAMGWRVIRLHAENYNSLTDQLKLYGEEVRSSD
jgi:very-short-patch-repair endonuclease